MAGVAAIPCTGQTVISGRSTGTNERPKNLEDLSSPCWSPSYRWTLPLRSRFAASSRRRLRRASRLSQIPMSLALGFAIVAGLPARSAGYRVELDRRGIAQLHPGSRHRSRGGDRCTVARSPGRRSIAGKARQEPTHAVAFPGGKPPGPLLFTPLRCTLRDCRRTVRIRHGPRSAAGPGVVPFLGLSVHADFAAMAKAVECLRHPTGMACTRRHPLDRAALGPACVLA